MIKLYGLPLSGGVAKVRYCLSYLNLEYELISISPMKKENQTQEFRAINPTGKIPAIDIDGFALFESCSINRYLADINDSSLYPKDLKQRALVDAWTDYGAIHVGPAQSRVGFNRVMAPMFGVPVDEASLKTGIEFLAKYLPVVERQLSKDSYLVGNDVTLADINMLTALDGCELSEISLEDYPHILKWQKHLMAQDFYQSCYPSYTEFARAAMQTMQAERR